MAKRKTKKLKSTPRRRTKRHRRADEFMTPLEGRAFMDQLAAEQNAIAAHNANVAVARVIEYAKRQRIDLHTPDGLARADAARERAHRRGGRKMVVNDVEISDDDTLRRLNAAVAHAFEQEGAARPHLTTPQIYARIAAMFRITPFRGVAKSASPSWVSARCRQHRKYERSQTKK